MARMLSRSKSMRLLRGGQKEIHQQDSDKSTPQLDKSQVDLIRLKAATLVTTEGNLDTPDMVARPKTSGGPGEHSRGKLFHRKVAPATLSSEDSKTNISFINPNKSSATVLYTAEIHEDTEGVIGIALGSPTMNPAAWNSAPYASELGTVTQISAATTPTEAKQEAPKPKLSRWKSIFGKKTPAPPVQKPYFYQLAQTVVPPRADSHHDEESIYSRSVSRAEEVPLEPRSVSPPVFKPEIRQSRMLPKGQDQPSLMTRPRALTTTIATPSKPKFSLMRSISSPKPNDTWREPPSVPQVVVSDSSQRSLTPTLGGGPLLDVAIPNIKLDRYSIMFNSVLQSNSSQPSNSPSNRSSLLVRRQGNSERLKPLNELSSKKEGGGTRNLKPQRRATSPSFPKSPQVALSLFPQPARDRAPSPRVVSIHNKPRPLRRSKTAPASSPSRRNFPKAAIDNVTAEPTAQEKAVHEIEDLLKSLDPPQTNDPETKPASPIQNSTPQKQLISPLPKSSTHDEWPTLLDPNTTSQLFSPSEPSPSSRHSFDSDTEEVTVVVRGTPDEDPWIPGEPQWEIVSRPSQRTALRSHPTTLTMGSGPSSAPLVSTSGQDSEDSKQPHVTSPLATSPLAPKSAGAIAISTSPPSISSDKPKSKAASPLSPSKRISIRSPQHMSPRLETTALQTTTVGVARSVSVSRASPRSAELKTTLVRRATEKSLNSPASGRLIDQKPLTPTLVELKNRRSQRVVVVDA